MAVTLRRMEGTPSRATAGSALRKLVAAMPGDDAAAAHELAGRIHLLGGVAATPSVPHMVTDALSTRRVLRMGTATARAPARGARSSHWATWARPPTGTWWPGAGCAARYESSAPTGYLGLGHRRGAGAARLLRSTDLGIPAGIVSQLTLS